MLARVLIVVLLAALAAAGLQTWRLSSWKDRAERSEALVAGYQEAARLRVEQDRRQRLLREQAADIDERLLSREGGDAPLSDYLRDAARDVWP